MSRQKIKSVIEKRTAEIVLTFVLIGLIAATTQASEVSNILDAGSSSDLVAEYRFDTGAGDTVYSSAGNNKGNLEDSVTWGKGIREGSVKFDGDDGRVNLGGSGDVTGEEITISFWSYWKDAGDQDHPIISKNPTTNWEPGNGYVVGTGWNDDFRVGIGSNLAIVGSESGIKEDRWQHFTVTYKNGVGMKLYRNGKLQYTDTSFSGKVGHTDQNLWVGDAVRGGNWKGRIDNIHVYSKSINKSQVRSLYNSGSWRVGSTTEEADPSKVLDVSFQHKNSSHVYDTSGYDNHGTPQNGASQEEAVNCKVGRCYSFDGGDDRIDIPSDSSNTLGSTSFSVSLWYYTEKGAGAGGDWRKNLISNRNGYNNDPGYHLSVWNNSGYGQFELQDSSGTEIGTGSTPRSLNKWTHLTGVVNRSSDKIKLYINGRLNDTTDISSLGDITSSRKLYIGSGAGGFNHHGKIDQIKIFNRSLSQQEIIEETEGLSSNGAVLDMQFNSNGGDHVEDYSGNGNYGRLKPNESRGPIRKTGKKGEVLDFKDGDSVRASLNLSELHSYSISTWVKWDSLTSNSGNLGNAALESVSPRFDYSIHGDSSTIRTYAHPGNPSDVGSVSYSIDPTKKWHHVVAWRDHGEVRLYVDGVLRGTDTVTDNSVDTTEISLGKNSGFSGDQFDGKLNSVRAYPYAISDTKVQRLYNQGKQHVSSDSIQNNLRKGLVLSQSFDRVETCGQSDTISCPSGMGGDVAVDESGEANHGDLVNSPTKKNAENCKVGGCLEFDGNDDSVEVSDDSGLDFDNSSFALSLWFKTGSKSISDQDMLEKTNGWDNGIRLRVLNNYLAGVVGDGTNVVTPSSNKEVTDREWHHGVLKRDSSGDVKLFLDGVQASTTSFAGNVTVSSKFHISTSGEFNGKIDQIRIYNQSLSKQEIWKLYTKGRDRSSNGEMAGPVGRWRFDEDTSSVHTEQKENVNLQADGNGNTVSLGKVSFDDSGWYKISYGSTWQSETAGGRHYIRNWIKKNGGSTVTPSENRCYIRGFDGDSCSNSGVMLVNANKGDYVELLGTKLSGSNGETVTVDDHYLYTQRVDNPVAQAWDTTGGQNYDSGTITLDLTDSTKVDSEFSFSSSSDYLQVNEDGLYKVFYSINNDDTGQGNRQVPHSWIRLNGNSLPSEHPIDSYSYLRNTGSYNHQTGTGLLNLNANDYLQVRQKKEHQQSSGSSETEPDRNWLLLEKLPTDNVLQVIERSGGQRINNGDTDSITFDTDIIEGSRYTHNQGSSKIFVNETGWYEVSYSFAWDDGANGGRHILTGWLKKNGEEKILPSEQRDYTRGCCSGRKNTITSNTVQKFQKGDYIELRVNARGGYGDVVANGTYVTLTPIQGAPDSASDNHGLVKGDPVWKSGKKENAIEFDGSDDHVNISSNTELTGFDEFTISTWVVSGNWQDFICKDGQHRIRYRTSPNDFWFNTNFQSNGGISLNTEDGLKDNKWYHVAMKYDGKDFVAYVDGEEQGRTNIGDDQVVVNNNDFILGATCDLSYHFGKSMDDVRIYPYALSQDQVKQVMNDGATSVG